MSNAQSTEVTRSKITIDKKDGSLTYSNENQKEGTKSIQFRQIVTTKSFYAARKAHSEFSGGLFDQEEFGFQGQVFTSVENRVAWENVPVSATDEQILERLEKWNNSEAMIYRILSNQPILSKNDEDAIAAGLRTKEFFANKQVVRYPDNDEQGRAGQIALDLNGKVQYRRTGLASTPVEDEDYRTSDPSEEYKTPEIIAELQGSASMVNQTI